MRSESYAFAAVVVLLPAVTFAHHGQASNGALYLTDDFIELDGEITDVFWRNPHTRARMRVVDDNGEETIWELELGPNPAVFEGSGIFADDLLGRAKAAGYRSRRDPESLGALHLLLPSGQEWGEGNRELLWSNTPIANETQQDLDPAKIAAAERTADGIFRVWNRYRGREYLGMQDSEFAQLLTPRGHELAAEFDPATDIPELDCETGMPRAMFRAFGSMQIARETGRIVIRRDTYDVERIVYLNDQSIPRAQASPFGFSVGHWEGDVLVVDTTHVNWPYISGGTNRNGAAPQSDQVSYKETFALSDEENGVLNYELTITDPVMFTEPFTHRSDWRWTPGIEVEPYDCAAEWEEPVDEAN